MWVAPRGKKGKEATGTGEEACLGGKNASLRSTACVWRKDRLVASFAHRSSRGGIAEGCSERRRRAPRHLESERQVLLGGDRSSLDSREPQLLGSRQGSRQDPH